MIVAMHFVDLLALVVLVWQFHRGMRRGALVSMLGIVRVLCAYIGAYKYAGSVGEFLRTRLELANTTATIAGGILVFFSIYFAIGLLMGIADRAARNRRRERGEAYSILSRLVGGAFGAVIGALIIVMICWMYSVVRGSTWGDKIPDISASTAMKTTKYLISRGAYGLLRGQVGSEQRAKRLARMISEPDQTAAALRELTQTPAVDALINSPNFGNDFLSGDPDRILRNKEFTELLRDSTVMHQVEELGFLEVGGSGEAFERALAVHLANVGLRTEEILQDPEVKPVIEELHDEGLLERDRIHQLLLDSRFHTILDRLMTEPSGETKNTQSTEPSPLRRPEIT